MIKKKKQDYLRLIAEHFPEVKFVKSKFITTGWDNDVIILDDEFVFRFPKRDEYLPRFAAEVKLLNYLTPKSPIPVPNYTHVSPDLSFGGHRDGSRDYRH